MRSFSHLLIFAHCSLPVHLSAQNYPALWLHVDAAWAGVFLACPELRSECQLHAINARSLASTGAGTCASGEVHSFCTNLHKSGLVTFDASCLWVRNRKLLTDALDITPSYLRNKQSDLGESFPFLFVLDTSADFSPRA